ncbi:hypothetical protein HF521_001813 [Silurus meridionalis]|uniref:Immunoglobulin V-set domain-containing protein n=1 Tax=Silurus meridionalis TaxID=175797 RepID=A0A8T0B7V0_SILME|nr:hypothetical protein HF521_001813 [Silurus meridionalis]
MAVYLLLFTLQLLFGLIRPSFLQNISADLISVSPGANITLLCNITNYSQKSCRVLGKLTSCSFFSHTIDSTDKAENIYYTTVQYKRMSTASATNIKSDCRTDS